LINKPTKIEVILAKKAIAQDFFHEVSKNIENCFYKNYNSLYCKIVEV